MRRRIKCVLFDLDGTLINTNNLVVESLKHTIREHLHREVAASELYRHFGEPLVDIMRGFSTENYEEMIKTYRAFNLIKHDELTAPFPGTDEMLKTLEEKDIRLGVVTSKIRSLAERGLKLFDLDRHMDVLICYEDTKRHKPDPEPINKALEQLPFDPGEVLMVGDSPFDLECAHNAGVFSAAVRWSVHPLEKLLRYKPDLVLSSFADLAEIV